MEETLSALVGAVNLILWDYMLIYALLGIGLFFTLYLARRRLPNWGRGSNPSSAVCFPKRQR